MHKKAKLLCFIFILFWQVACSANQLQNRNVKSQEITVFAAASLTNAMNELAKAYEAQNTNTNIIFHFAGSSQLAAQLREGIVADVFAPANPAQMQAVIAAGRVDAGTEALFVANQLTIIVPVDNPAGIGTLEDLVGPGVQLILAAKGVPVREYSDAILARMPIEFQAQFYSNLVSEEDNVRQVLAKIALGEADAGIVYTSDITPKIAQQVQQINIPAAQNVIATYPIAPLANAPEPELAQQFIKFVLSEEGQAIISRWGFSAPPGY